MPDKESDLHTFPNRVLKLVEREFPDNFPLNRDGSTFFARKHQFRKVS